MLAGCVGNAPKLLDLPDSAEKAANVYVAAYPAVPWDEISDQLDPKHNLTIEQARGLAVQTTQLQVSQFLSTFAAGLAIGLPQRATIGTQLLNADGSTTTTGSRSTGSGTPPASSGMASSPITDAALAGDLSKGPAVVGVDGSTLLTAATALYQQAKILDNQIAKAIRPKGYRAHLITLQVNLQPVRRDLPYDTFINVSFAPGTWMEALATSPTTQKPVASLMPAVIIYPLIITDALEASSTGRSIEQIRQAALSIAGVAGVVGVNAGVAGGSDTLDSTVNLDKNSLVTVGRVNDSTLRIRLGAANGGVRKFTMVPRTYNVSMVVLTRDIDAAHMIESLSVVTRSTLRDATTGEPLERGAALNRGDLVTRVNSLVEEYWSKFYGTCDGSVEAPDAPSKLTKIEDSAGDGTKTATVANPALILLRALDSGDYAMVKQCLAVPDTDKLTKERTVTLRRLLARLMEQQESSRYSLIQVPLSEYSVAEVPPDQFAVASDDGKEMQVVVRGGKGLSSKVIATLAVTNQLGKTLALQPSSIVVSGGSAVALTFPSPTALKVTPTVTPLSVSFQDSRKVMSARTYEIANGSEPKAPPGNPARATSSIIVADSAGIGQLNLVVGAVPSGKAVLLQVTGADVRQDVAIGAPSAGSKGVAVTAEAVTTLRLGNLTPGVPVVISATVGGEATGTPLRLTVERALRSR